MRRSAAAMILAVLLLGGCGNTDETYLPAVYADEAPQASDNDNAEPEQPAVIKKPPAASASSSEQNAAISSSSEHARAGAPYTYTAENIPELAEELDANRAGLTFTLNNIYSEGALYSAELTAAHGEEDGTDDITLTLFRDGKPVDTLDIRKPDGEQLVMLENAEDINSYGCEVISNIREFGAEEYPDFFGLIFRESSEIRQSDKREAAVPEYARYFTIFGGKLWELPIFENGRRTAPCGMQLEPRSAGLAIQHLTVLKSSGEGYEINKFEFRFYLENKRLNKQQVRFYGWDR